MKKTYNEVFTLEFPEGWEAIPPSKYAEYGVQMNHPEMTLQEAFLVPTSENVGVVTLFSYIKSEGFLKDYQTELDSLKRQADALNESGIDWRKFLVAKPILYGTKVVKGTKVYISIMETSTSTDAKVIQLFYKCSGNLFCFNGVLPITVPNSQVLNYGYIKYMINSVVK